jgi:predicted ATPase/DNA-binding SARP family transcriptional activator
MSKRLALYLLGAPRLELNNSIITVDRRKTLALLAYLAVNRWGHHRDHISALLWPEYEQSKAFTNLRHILWEIRQAIGEGWIIAARDTIALIAEGADQPSERFVWLDVARFKSLITESRSQNDILRRISLLSDSVKLYRNHFLTGFSLKNSPDFNEWAFAESEELRHQLASALGMLTNDYCSLGQAETAIPHAERLITLDPLNESSHRQLMQVYIQAGQHTAAIKQYQTCEQILRKELGVDPQPETRALYKQIRKGEIKPVQQVQLKGTILPEHNLPFPISKFIGREKELDEVKDLIADHRLVTLVGTGGIGKTRLSLKAGEHLLNEYIDGIWFVELASLGDPLLVPQAVAKLFNLIEQSGESLTEKLIRALRPKTLLLILDNCEHVLDACAQLVDGLLRNCPKLKILATSREPLGITGEAQYHVPPLALPDIQQLLEQILGYESIQLFEERARLVQENFSLTTLNASSIAHICQRLDGIPLAIELAAARVNLLSAEQIALRLDESFGLLTGGGRTTLPRHQTLRASIDWSWTLLSEPEQTLLRRLSIFAGGWTLDAAAAVCAGNGIEPGQVLEVMTQLLTKSLVVVSQESGREKRYGLLEMVRQYANEKLLEADEEEHIRIGHLKYYLNLSERIEYELVRSQQKEWYARANEERDNLRAALEQAGRTDVEAGLYISSQLQNFWESFDNSEGARWLAEFLQKPESKDYPRARAKALCAQGWFLALGQQLEAAHAAVEECLALYRAVGDQHGEVDGLNLRGFISIADGDKKVEYYCQQALALARSLGDVVRQTTALNIMGWAQNDFKRGITYWEEAIPLYRDMGNWRPLANCLGRVGLSLVMEGEIEAAQKYLDESSLLYRQLDIQTDQRQLFSAYGQIALMRGDYEEARAYFQENARVAKELGNRLDYLWSNTRIGDAELREGNLTEARRIFAETAQEFQKDRYTIGLVFILQCMASLYVAAGKAENAARLIGWGDRMREEIGDTRPSLEQAEVDRLLAATLTRLGKAAFEEAYDQGRLMTLDEAVAYALDGG